jgi:hypothetical protein
MSIETYYLLRNKCNQIIKEYEYIIQLYEDIKQIEEFEQVDELENQYNIIKDKIQHVKYIKNTYDEKIYQLCCHDFVEDTIDIHPEKCKVIRYCQICEYTEQ